MHYVAERIRPYCKDLSAVFIQPGEGYFSSPDFTLFKSLNKDVHIFDMGSVAENYIRSLKAVEKNLDWEYIKKIENSYTAFSSLNEQLLTEMTLLPYYHDRKHYEYIDYNKILLYVQIYYQYIENLFKNNKPDVILDNHQFSIYGMLREAAIRTIVSIRYFSLKKIKLNILKGINSPICSNEFRSYQFMYMYYIRRLYLEYSNLFDKKDLTTVNYIYLPLHVIPESSTTGLSPYYINETFIIESLSKSVRPDQYILVKEHWSMIGYRPISYYKKIKRLPNVILIDPGGQYLPKDYIKNSDLVVTISGSAAIEASIMGINSLVFSDVIYGMLSSVRKIHIDSNLRKTVSEHINYKMPEQELYAYIKLLLQYGRKVRLKNLLKPPSRTKKEEIEQDITNLIDVFTNGIKLYQENRRK